VAGPVEVGAGWRTLKEFRQRRQAGLSVVFVNPFRSVVPSSVHLSNPNQQSTTSQSGPKMARSKRAGRGKPVDRPLFEPNAAGIDIGAREI
jgi:hypothetical protein